MLFGTDYPYSADFRAKEAIEYIESYGFTEEEKENIFFRNAAGLFSKLKVM
jgi:predicted TIM-barrel fold metal-dependent hydrolase